jgi:S-DNA-T family DNA segregation ATPase FtsK/SpoIIIE
MAGKSTPPPSKSKASQGKPAAKSSRRKTSSQPENLPPLFPKISAERKVDIIGGAMALVGVLTLVALISANKSSVTGGWLYILGYLFGWGSYLLPIALIVVGGWLVLRKIERIPTPSAERLTGVILLYLFLLTFLQFAAGNPEPYTMSGGGWLGRVLYGLLDTLLGTGGVVVILVAWLLIGIIMTLDVSMQQLYDFYAPVIKRFIIKVQTLFGKKPAPAAEKSEFNGDFTPLDRSTLQKAGQAPSEPDVPPLLLTTAPKTGQPIPAPVATGAPIEWKLPAIREILEPGSAPSKSEEFIESRARLIEETLASFGAPAQVIEINEGPTVTQFGVEPLFIESRQGRTRVRVSKIVSLADDLALVLAAPRIRIQAPVPGRNYVGIEVPNDEMALVALRDIMEGETFQRNKKPLSLALGKDVSGHPANADLTTMPHLLIAGTTGSGKSVCVNSILTCMLINNSPDDLRLILVDPKRVELTGYNGIPHLLAPVVVEMERVVGALQWMLREMDKRYHEFAQAGARNIQDYNAHMKSQGGKKIPYLVVVIDELADLMLMAPDETERTITRLAQLARATGIHMILATQRPSVDVVTGLIKANFPARIAFAVASNTDSRVILDQPGAERLLGRGDMLYQAPDAPSPSRLQGVFVSDSEIHRLVEFWRAQNPHGMPITSGGPVDAVPSGVPLKQVPMFEDMSPEEQGDPLMKEAIDLVRREGRASVSMLQRRLRIGYTRAARLVDEMEEKKIVGQPQDATGVRPVLDYGPAAPPKEN